MQSGFNQTKDLVKVFSCLVFKGRFESLISLFFSVQPPASVSSHLAYFSILVFNQMFTLGRRSESQTCSPRSWIEAEERRRWQTDSGLCLYNKKESLKNPILVFQETFARKRYIVHDAGNRFLKNSDCQYQRNATFRTSAILNLCWFNFVASFH